MHIVAVIVLGMCLGVVAPERTNRDSCSQRTTCGDCLSVVGCQWCAVEMMSNSTQRRCRKRPDPGAAGASLWCPEEQILDPVDLSYATSGEHHDFEASPYFVTPEKIIIETRLSAVDVEFNVKTETGRRFQEVELKTDSHLSIITHTRKELYTDNKWTVYTVNVTLPATCDSSEEIKLAVGPYSVSVHLLRTNCDCNCGRDKEQWSERCSGHGALSCGGCECSSEWSGEFCEKTVCKERGDINLCSAPDSDVECAGVGKCECGRCVCPLPAYFYYDDFCSDLCSATTACAVCFQSKLNSTDFYYNNRYYGDALTHRCQDECLSTELVTAGGEDGTLCSAVDEEGCGLTYMSWRTDVPRIQFWERNCSLSDVIVAAAGGGSAGLIGGVLGVLLAALVVAGGGVALWRAAHAPRDVLAGLEYQHMDAEANQGENPLYKPPTSKYINPLYQQTNK